MNGLSIKSAPGWHSEGGHTAFYVLFMLPIIFCVSGLALDVGRWNAYKNELQKKADAMTLRAAEILPDRRAVSALLDNYASVLRKQNVKVLPGNHGETPSSFIEANGLGVGIILEANYGSLLWSVLNAFSALSPKAEDHGDGVDSTLSVRVESSSTLLPLDYVIVLPDGDSVHPSFDPESFAFAPSWGDSEAWPAAGYFDCASRPDGGWSGSKKWDEEGFEKGITEACFNPVFSSLKATAISIIDNVTASRANRASVVFTPGDTSGRGYAFLRKIHRVGGETGETPGGFFDSASVEPEARFLDRDSEGRAVYPAYGSDPNLGDEMCVLLSHPSADYLGVYRLSALRQDMSGHVHEKQSDCADALAASACTVTPEVSTGGAGMWRSGISPCYLSERGLLLREAIWWHWAPLRSSTFRPQARIFDSIVEAWGDLVYSTVDSRSGETTMRGNLARDAGKRIIVMTNVLDVPTASRLDTLLKDLSSSGVELFLIAFGGRGADENLSSAVSRFKEAASALVLRSEISEKTLRVLELSGPRELLTKALPAVTLASRRVILKR